MMSKPIAIAWLDDGSFMRAYKKLTDGTRPSDKDLAEIRDQYPRLRPLVAKYLDERRAAPGR